MNHLYKSSDAICRDCNEETVEQHLLHLLFSNSVKDLLEFIEKMIPLCHHTWISAQHLVSIASSRFYHKSYICLLKYFRSSNLSRDAHSCYCSCMKIDLNHFNKFGITPFLKSLPCNYEVLSYQLEMGANLYLSPRCSLFVIINPLFAYMKHLVNQVYDQTTDDIDVVSCLSFLCNLGLDPNYVPPNVCSNLMVLFSIAADISIQSEFENRQTKEWFLNYLDGILEVLLKAGLDPTLRNNSNKLSYEVHGDGLFDFIFMLKYPSDEMSIEHVCRWITMLIQHGCNPELEMRSKCRDLLKFKLIANKPNIAISIFFYVIHELFDDDFINSPNIRRINDVLNSLTSQKMKNMTISYFKKTYSDSMFSHFFTSQPKSLKYLARFSVSHGVLDNRLLNIEKYNIPTCLINYVKDLH